MLVQLLVEAAVEHVPVPAGLKTEVLRRGCQVKRAAP